MALRHLRLHDFVIVPELELAFEDGFTALTGETGAGKSILIDALQLVLGGRGDAQCVREGRKRCEISAEFDLDDKVNDWLAARGFDDTADALLLRRTIDASGKSRAWINGSAATTGQLREVADWLVDIHGQHAWQRLTRSAAVRDLLDAYAGVPADGLRQAWHERQKSEENLRQAQSTQQEQLQNKEQLGWQIAELDKLAPREGEWDELNLRHTRLSHAQALIECAQANLAALEGDDGGGTGALPALSRAGASLAANEHIEPAFAALAQQLESSVAQAQEVARGLHAYLRHQEADPASLQALDTRLSQWMALARRYRHPPAELAELLAAWRAQLGRLELAADLDALVRAAEQANQRFLAVAREASSLRTHAAPRLAAAVTEAMQLLGMKGGRFEVQLEANAEPAAHGLENAAFLVAAHAGSTPRPIEKVASGGELSRLALAIAVTTSSLGPAGTLVFDEVDSGVGGAVASTVGSLLRQLGRDRQVLCVTHLPQVASCADHHLLVDKTQSESDGPVSRVRPLDADDRTREIARMLTGKTISAAALAHARELVEVPATQRKARRA